jgi:hypothetical protein
MQKAGNFIIWDGFNSSESKYVVPQAGVRHPIFVCIRRPVKISADADLRTELLGVFEIS